MDVVPNAPHCHHWLRIFRTFPHWSNDRQSIVAREWWLSISSQHLPPSTTLFIRATRNRRHNIDIDREKCSHYHFDFVRFLHNLVKYAFRHAIIKSLFTPFAFVYVEYKCAIVRLIFTSRFFTAVEWRPLQWFIQIVTFVCMWLQFYSKPFSAWRALCRTPV